MSCPLCRAELRTKCHCEMSGEEEFEAELQSILRHRATRPAPTQYRVVSHLGGIRSVLASDNPAGTDVSQLWDHINNDVDDSDYLFTAGGDWRAGLQIISSADLIRRADEFQLDYQSLDRLWVAERLFGARWFHLTQVLVRPEIGFWTPLLPDVRVVDTFEQLPLRELLYESSGAQSNTARIPLPTGLFCKMLRSSLRLYPWEAQYHIRHVYQEAHDKGVTHWRLLSFSGDQLAGTLYAMPWPQDLIEEGFTDSITQSTISPPSWSPDYDRDMLIQTVNVSRQGCQPDYDEDTFCYYGEVPSEADIADVNFFLMDDPDFAEEEEDVALNYD